MTDAQNGHRWNEGKSMLYARLTLVLLITWIYPAIANVDSDQLASEEANWSGSALFVIKYLNL